MTSSHLPFLLLCKKICKKSAIYVLSAGLLLACQPPNTDTSNSDQQVDTPVVIEEDSVTMSPEHILSIKSSRYQPSLGLQGNLEPAEQQKMIAAQDIVIDKVLVKEGQWVKEGAPLFIVHRKATQKGSDESKSTGKIDTQVRQIQTNKSLVNRAKSDEGLSELTAEDTQNQKMIQDQNALKPEEMNKGQPFSNSLVKTDNTSKANTTLKPDSTLDTDTSAEPLVNKGTESSKQGSAPITVLAKKSGYISGIFVQPMQTVESGVLLLELGEKSNLHFIATLPIQAKSQLSIGQTVNFTAEKLTDTFTGQVSKLDVDTIAKQLFVSVSVIGNETSREKLKPGMAAMGRVNYGQIEVGTIVPKSALHDVDLSTLQKPPYQSITPLTANIWIIKQDQRLTRQPVEVIEYDPSTDQYLIAGVSNDSLICLADLPVESAGKSVIVS